MPRDCHQYPFCGCMHVCDAELAARSKLSPWSVFAVALAVFAVAILVMALAGAALLDGGRPS
ncbi:MAG: hypothetical protein K5872_22000 [Rhizobiaceae bacterium]|nr:hypothetical protein [Rhizobiaceae bacterium]MCV0408893.1 hypothetical protein [Rhizobiaceae bacterium]